MLAPGSMIAMRNVLWVLLSLLWIAAPRAEAASLADVDAEAMSGDPVRIRKAIDAYRGLDAANPDVQWRLVRAYFNYYDELTDLNRRADQQWAADTGYALAVSAIAKHPQHPELLYYYATIGLCYLDFHRFKAVFLVNALLETFEKTRKLVPALDDGGSDRSLGILYHELPGWPLGRGDKKKSLYHLKEAVRISPERAANRLTLAKVLAETDAFEEGWTHVEFVRAGNFKVSSPHWKQIYLRRVEEVAQEFPQHNKP